MLLKWLLRTILLEEHNLDDNSEEITQWEPEVGAAVAAACGAAAHATVAEDSH
jgi:hypothetical protein